MSAQRAAGRPGKLTPELHEALIKMLRTGCTNDVAAEAVGISTRALRLWLQKGEEASAKRDDGEKVAAHEVRYIKLAEDVRKARSEAEVRAVATIQRAAQDGTWQAAAWYLERAFPERWSSKGNSQKVGRPTGSASAPDRINTSKERLKVVSW